MLTRVEVTTRQGALLDLPLSDDSSGIVVGEIEGLDPVTATLVSSSFANMDGSQYHSSRRESRNIKITLDLAPDYIANTVQSLRNTLYSFFMPKTEVNLRFHVSDILYVDILGRVETFESPLFTDDPAVVISLMCFDPDFIDPNPVTFGGVTTAGLDEILHTYAGSVETGLVFTLPVDRSLSQFTIYHRPPDGTLRTMDFSSPLLAGDTLRISTVFGVKSVIRTRGGVETSLLYNLSPQSNWLELQPGDNYFRVYAEGYPIPFTVNYSTRYGGL